MSNNYFGGTPSYQCILLTEFPDQEIIESVVKRAKSEHFTAEFIEGKRGHYDPYILVKSELCHIDEALFRPFREWFQYTYPELTKNKIRLRWT